MTITVAAVDAEATVVFRTLLDDGQRERPDCGTEGRYRDTVIRRVTDLLPTADDPPRRGRP